MNIFVFLFTGSVLDNGNSYTSGRHANLLAATSASRQVGITGNGIGETTQVCLDRIIHGQCDQMSRIFCNIWPFLTMKICPIMLYIG